MSTVPQNSPYDGRASTQSGGLRSRPRAALVLFLAVFTVVFVPLHATLGDAAFIVCNLMPLLFASIFGMRWGLLYAVVHALHGLALGGMVQISFERFVSHGIPANLVTIAISGGIGRIRDLTCELQGHRVLLESLVEERTGDLVRANAQLRLEIVEREKAQAEKQSLEASLKRAEKMEAIGMLAGNVAHDLNNILSSLIVYPELLLLDLPEGSPLREPLLSIQASGQRAAAVVDDLLTMARRSVTSREVLDLNDTISDLMLSPEIAQLRVRHPNASIETRLDPALLRTRGSAVHLARAVLNLVLNSVEAIENEGRVVLSTSNVYVDEPTGGYELLQEGEYVALAVQDDGIGIAAEDIDHVFEPFYTKKAMGRSGTGLGMAIVWGTVKDHGGFVDVRSEVGMGTTVTLLLPATRDDPRAEASAARVEEYVGRGESILVVDDVRTQRDLCAAILTRLGYAVTCVASGEEAVQHVARRQVDLIVLDMVMEPGIDGLETYRRIVAIRPEQRAIIASGFSETAQVREAQTLGAGRYVRKPYTLETMGAAVRDALAGGA